MSSKSSQSVQINDFGERLRLAFDNASNAEIARQLGVSNSAVKNYIEGRVTLPLVMQISNLTGCSTDWLLTGEGNKSLKQSNPSFDKMIRETIKQIFQDELLIVRENRKEEIQELGTIDEFDLEAKIKEIDNVNGVLREWYKFEGVEVPTDFGMSFNEDRWKELTLEQKIKQIKNLKTFTDLTF